MMLKVVDFLAAEIRFYGGELVSLRIEVIEKELQLRIE